MITFLIHRYRAKQRQAQTSSEIVTHDPPTALPAKLPATPQGPETPDATYSSTEKAILSGNDIETTQPDVVHQEKSNGVNLQDSNHVGPAGHDSKEAKRAARVYRFKLIAGLCLPFFLASLDLTVVATALPFIASHFDKINQLNWIVTSFTLTSTAFIPAFGQLADVFGRHMVLQTTMSIMIIGSALCAGATSFTMLLFGRAIQGVSAAGIMNLIKIILADKVTLKENATNNTVFSLVSGLSYGVGPVIGGYLTKANWRYCFVINVPICFFSMAVIFFLLRKELIGPTPSEHQGRLASFTSKMMIIDYGGLALFLFGVALVIVGTTWGGSTYAWRSVAVLVPIIFGGLFIVMFVCYEYLMEPGRIMAKIFPRQRPMIPVGLFLKKDLGLLAYINAATGAALYSVFYFVGIYFTLVKGYTANNAGTQLLYYLPGIGVGVYLAMFLCNRYPRQTHTPLFFGSLIEAVGIGVLAWALTTGRISVIGGIMGLAGCGTGLRFMPATLHMTGIWPTKIAQAMSVMSFALPFGGTVALAIMGAVFNNKLVRSQSSTGKINPHDSSSLQSISALSPAAQAAFRQSANNAVFWAFISIVPILCLAVVAASFLGNVSITQRDDRTESGHLDSRHDVYEGIFLLEPCLVRGRNRSRPLPDSQVAEP